MVYKSLDVDFGLSKKTIRVPKDACVAEFLEPVPLKNPENELESALKNPHGSVSFESLLKPNMTVAIGFDDPTRPPAPWQLILPNIIEKLIQNGVQKKDILLICANGNHKKWTERELRQFLGEQVFNEFWSCGQLLNHDCSCAEELAYLGKTSGGCIVEHNKAFLQADLMVYVGQVMVNSWGGYTGTGAVVGLASTRSILSHHNHKVVNDPRTTRGDHKQMYFRKLKAEINRKIESETKKRIFYINYVGGTGGEISGIFAGFSPEMDEPSWEAADKFSIVNVPQADIFVIGLTESYAYGSANNPLIATIGMTYPTRVWLGAPLLKKGGVVIGLSSSNGEIDETIYPSYQEVLDLASKQKKLHNLTEYQDDISTRPDYLKQYKEGNAYHPIHPFWLLYASDYTLSRASKVIICGSQNKSQFLKIGIDPISEFDEALEIGKAQTNDNPTIVVAPSYWSKRTFKFNVTTG